MMTMFMMTTMRISTVIAITRGMVTMTMIIMKTIPTTMVMDDGRGGDDDDDYDDDDDADGDDNDRHDDG